MAKKIAKSIRLSDEVYGYIMEMPGNGFNEKFENIILEAKNGEAERKKRLSDLEKSIDDCNSQLFQLLDRYDYLKDYFRMFVGMRFELDRMRTSFEKAIGKQLNDETTVICLEKERKNEQI